MVGDLQPASIDLRLDTDIVIPRKAHDPIEIRIPESGWLLPPNLFVLGCTTAHVKLSDDIAAQVNGKSSLGRLGLIIHVTAGFVDPGFEGQLTLEMYNLSQDAVLLKPGMKICQLHFFEMTTKVERPYGSRGLGSHYQGQMGPTPSRIG